LIFAADASARPAVIFAIFIDSWLFVFSSTVLQSSFGLNSGPRACDAGILLCLVCYLSSKVLPPANLFVDASLTISTGRK
jgi:hypothetical protein